LNGPKNRGEKGFIIPTTNKKGKNSSKEGAGCSGGNTKGLQPPKKKGSKENLIPGWEKKTSAHLKTPPINRSGRKKGLKGL